MIKVLVMDVDGTLTDGKIYIGKDEELFKAFNVKDGYGITQILSVYGIKPVIITGRKSEILEMRCKELGISEVYQNAQDKKIALIEYAGKFGISLNEEGILPGVAYIGDDIPDLECIKIVEKSGCPSDAVKEIKKHVHYITQKDGGEGAVREFIEWIVLGEELKF